MTYNPEIHHRHSIRLKDYVYSQNGAYFVTICTLQRECLFGEIVNGEMVSNDMGRIVVDEWEKTGLIRSNVDLDVFAVMPNHFHAIFLIHDNVGAQCMRPESVAKATMLQTNDNRAHVSAPLRRQSGSIGSVFAGFKSATTKQINMLRNNPGCPLWQRNYYERVIRNEDELSRAREYIINNPMKWELDKENPVNCRDNDK
jgi:REP element-mobilizing transposase RayT